MPAGITLRDSTSQLRQALAFGIVLLAVACREGFENEAARVPARAERILPGILPSAAPTQGGTRASDDSSSKELSWAGPQNHTIRFRSRGAIS